MGSLSLETQRGRLVDSLEDRAWDTLVIGGGIVGAGVARDAALRGLRVALVEQNDFASGTSSRTSRLLHGGIRYLAQGRIRLVREASREKRLLHRIAPHLARPLAFVFPAYRGSKWPLWQLRLGVKGYDWLCGGGNLGRSGALDRHATLEHVPGLKGNGLAGAVRYFDALTNDARLVIDTIRSATAAGAVAGNYLQAREPAACPAGWRCRGVDAVTGRECKIQAATVVHAAGPWTERLAPSTIRLRLTKGVHLVIDGTRLPLADAVVMTEGDRVLFAIPWGRRVILGTTDTDYEGAIEEVATEPDDVDYLLDAANRFFPSAGLGRADVWSTWAGLRPLLASPDGGPSDISRAHRIVESQPGWFDVAGGKLTTYRRIAEQTVDRVVRRLGRKTPPCTTAEQPLLEPADVGNSSGIVPPEVCRQVVAHQCRNEYAIHLDDVMIRRGRWHAYQQDATETARQVAGWMAELFEWDETTRQAEWDRYRGLRH